MLLPTKTRNRILEEEFIPDHPTPRVETDHITKQIASELKTEKEKITTSHIPKPDLV